MARLVESCFGAVDPFGDAIFGLVAGTRRSFSHNRAGRKTLPAPAGWHCGGNLAKLVRERTGIFKRRVWQYEHQRPCRVFYGDIGLANGRRKRARQLLDILFDRRVTVLAEEIRRRGQSARSRAIAACLAFARGSIPPAGNRCKRRGSASPFFRRRRRATERASASRV